MIFSARFRYHHWASYIIAGGPDNDGSASLNIEVKVSVSHSRWCSPDMIGLHHPSANTKKKTKTNTKTYTEMFPSPWFVPPSAKTRTLATTNTKLTQKQRQTK